MTKAELEQRFYDSIGETSSDSFSTTITDRLLLASLRKLQSKYGIFPILNIVPVAEGINEFTLTQIKPTLATGQVIAKLHSAMWQQGESAAISAFATGGTGYTLVTIVGHGWSDKDEIQIWESTNYNGKWTLSSVATDTFKIAKTYVAEATPTAIAVKQSSYKRRLLQERSWESIQGYALDHIEPNAAEVPRGTLFLQWWINSVSLPDTTDVLEIECPLFLQPCIADDAIMRALGSDADVKLGSWITEEFKENRNMMKEWSEMAYPQTPKFFGRYNDFRGIYAYRQLTDQALIIFPEAE